MGPWWISAFEDIHSETAVMAFELGSFSVLDPSSLGSLG
jgi:hypothetical protein